MFEKVNKNVEVHYSPRALPEILISKEALNKMYIYVNECDKEIGWLGTVENDENTYLIKDVMLFEQEVTATTTDLCESDLNTFAHNVMETHGDSGMELLNSVKMWGHSHVNMSVFASGTDDATMDMFQEGEHDFFIRLIANKKNDLKIDLYDYENGKIFENLPFEVVMSARELQIKRDIMELEKQLVTLQDGEMEQIEGYVKAEMKEKVKTKKYSRYTKTSATPISKYKSGYKTETKDDYKDDYKNDYKSGYDYYFDYQDTVYPDKEGNYLIEGISASEELIYMIWQCNDAEDLRELLIENGLYTNQTTKQLEDIIDRTLDVALSY